MSKGKILMVHRQDTAVSYYRQTVPARILRMLGYEVLEYTKYFKQKDLDAWQRKMIEEGFDLLISDRCIDNIELGRLAGIRHMSPNMRMLVDFDDDFTNVPKWNQSYKHYKPGKQFHDISLQHLRLSEMALVSTDPLRETFKTKTHEITTLPNVIDPVDWMGFPINP